MTEVQKELIENGLSLSRDFNAPRELVFRALSESDLLIQWWGPEGFPVNNSSMDFRPGGQWLYSMRSEESGEEFWSIGFYQEIVAPEKIVLNDAFCNAQGRINPDLPQGRVTLTLTEHDGVTTFRNEVIYSDNAQRDQVVAMGMIEGMTLTLGQLDKLLTELKSS